MSTEAFSMRGVARAYGLSRCTVAAAIRTGELPAARIGRRRLLVLRRDAEAWLARNRVAPASAAAREHAEAVVDRVLERTAA